MKHWQDEPVYAGDTFDRGLSYSTTTSASTDCIFTCAAGDFAQVENASYKMGTVNAITSTVDILQDQLQNMQNQIDELAKAFKQKEQKDTWKELRKSLKTLNYKREV